MTASVIFLIAVSILRQASSYLCTSRTFGVRFDGNLIEIVADPVKLPHHGVVIGRRGVLRFKPIYQVPQIRLTGKTGCVSLSFETQRLPFYRARIECEHCVFSYFYRLLIQFVLNFNNPLADRIHNGNRHAVSGLLI